MSDSKVKFPLTLPAGGNQAVDAYFTVDENATQFEVKVSFEGLPLLMHSSEMNYANIDRVTYALEQDGMFYQINMVA